MSHAPANLRDLRVASSTAEVLRQHQDALEELRTHFNALEAKQRHQAHALLELAANDEDHAKAITGLRVGCLWFARGLRGRLTFLLTGR